VLVTFAERAGADRRRIGVSGSGDRPGGDRDTGPTAEAIPLLEQTLADRERLLGDDHPSTLYSRNNLALAYRDAGQTTEAITLLERTLADCERVLGHDHPDTLFSRNNLAVAYRDAGRTSEAIALYKRTLADCERVLGTNDRFTDLVRKGLVALTDRATHDTGKWLRFGLPGAGASERGDA
jgi:tetratricopeptide (TPR) repeat protein